MGEPGKVRIPHNALCRAHLLALVPEREPADVTWQARYTVACTALFERAVADPRVQARCRLPGDAPDAPPRHEMLTAVLAQWAPLCCSLGPDARAAVTQAVADAVARIRESRR